MHATRMLNKCQYLTNVCAFLFYLWEGRKEMFYLMKHPTHLCMVICAHLLTPFQNMFQPVLHNWSNKGCGMCYPVCGMKKPLLLITKNSLCGSSGFISRYLSGKGPLRWRERKPAAATWATLCD